MNCELDNILEDDTPEQLESHVETISNYKTKNKFSGKDFSLENYSYVDYFIYRALHPEKDPSMGKFFRSFCSASHYITIFSIALSVKSKATLELGVSRGATSLPLLQAACLTGGHVDSVDVKRTGFEPPKHMAKRWKFHKSDTIQFLKSVPKDKIYNVVYIDDCHDGLHVKKELDLIESHVNKQSIILLHDLMTNTMPDYNETEWENGGPCWAVKQLPRDKWEWATIPLSHGLTILRKIV